MYQRAKSAVAVPGLHFDTANHRRGPSHEAKEGFLVQMLNLLRSRWKNPDTEAQFLNLANVIETQGCALFGGLIDISKSEKLIDDYGIIQKRTGSPSFLHSYANLASDPKFIRNSNYSDTFDHPLLVALIAYCMGGAVRIIDMRGKDTDPMSANAQDNMLHIDNSSFKEEYKVLCTLETRRNKRFLRTELHLLSWYSLW